MATTDETGAGAAPVPSSTGPIDGAGFAGKAHEHRAEHDMNGSASEAADGSAAPPAAHEQGVDAPGGAQVGAVEGGASTGAAVGAAVQGEAADGSGSAADQGPAGVSSVSSSAAPTPPSPGSGSPGPAGTATAGSAGPGAGAGAVDAGGSDVAASGAGVADGGVDAVAARGGDVGDDVGAGPGHDGASGAGEGVAAPASAVGSALEPAAGQAAGGVVDDDDDDDDDGGGFFGSDDDDDDGDGDAFGAAGGGDAAGEEADVDMGVAPMGDGGRSAPAPAATVATPAVSAPAAAAVSAPLPSASAPGGGNVPAGTPPSAGTPGGVARTTAVGAAPSGAPAPAVVPPPPVPILRGTLSWREGDGKCVLSGQWAMSEKDPITSYFEYVSRLPAPASGQPHDGVYDGFFMMKLAATTEAKHEEKGLKLTFKPASVTDNQQAGDVLMRVEGAGKNVFNSFTLSGTYNPVTHEVVVHKAYAPKGRRGARGARGGRGRARGRGRKASTTPRKPRPAAMHRSLVGDNGAAVRTPASQQRRTSIATPRGAVPEITPRAQRKRALPAHLRQDAGPKMTEELQTCRKILKHLMQHEWAAPFLRAVDPVALNIPDYFDIIKQPMDLGTIETHMSKGTYTTHHEFANDVRLTFSNAVLYNKEGSDVHTMAKTLAAQFDQRFKEGMEAVAVRKRKVAAAERAEEAKRKSAKRRAMEERAATRTPRGSRSGRGGRGRGSGGKGAKGSMRRGSSVISDDDDSGTDSRSTSRTPGKKRPAPARTPRAGGGAKSAKKPRRATPRAAAPAPGPSAGVSGSEVAFLRAQLAALQKQVVQLQQTSVPVFTMEDKRALSQNINQLPTDKLDTVVEIITARMPALANRPSDEDMEIDIDSLDNGTLTELQQFVSSCLAPKPKPRARAKKPSARKSKNQARRQAETTHQVDVLDEQLRSLDGFDAYGSAPIGGGLGLPGPTIADDDDDFGDAGYF